MKKTFIISERGYNQWPSFDLVYEWEDEMVKTLPFAQIYHKKEIMVRGKHLLLVMGMKTGWGVDSLFIGGNRGFRFEMRPVLTKNPLNKPNISHCLIDFYLRPEQLDDLYRCYDKVEHLYVTNRQVYDFLLENHFPRKVEHLPLSLPDKYRIGKETQFQKEYDLVLVGRQNPVLMDFLKEYEKTHAVNYVTRGKIDGGHFPYFTNTGDFVGNMDTRDDYFNLLRKSRVAFYSTPGTDDEKALTNGFHQVTPRFLEELACGCHVISRYSDNSDTRFYELDKMTSKVDTYAEFEKAMDKALQMPVDIAMYASYLEGHYTSAVLKAFL